MPRTWDVYTKSAAVCIAACLLNLIVERRLASLVRDEALRWALAFAALQLLAIISVSLYLAARRAYHWLLEGFYEQLRPAVRERVLALATTGEAWAAVVPKGGASRKVLEESLTHVLAEVTQSGRSRVERFAIDQGFQAQWMKDFASHRKADRTQAIARLGLISDGSGSSLIEAALQDEHRAVRMEAARALLQTGELLKVDRVFRAVLLDSLLVRALLASDLKRHARYLLLTTIPDVLASPKPLELIRCLEFIISWERALPSFDVKPFLNDARSPLVRSLALKVLPYVLADDSIEDHLRGALNSSDADVRCAAARAVGKLKFESLIPCLSQSLNQDKRFAIAAATSLGELGVTGERQLEMAVNGPDRKAAAVAMEALEQLTVGLR